MSDGAENSPRRAPIDDSSPVVLHARQTVFVMLIVSALVAMGVLAEDVSRPSRAVDDARIIAHLMEFWRADRKPRKGPVPVSEILAGPVERSAYTPRAFKLTLSKVVEDGDNGRGNSEITCTVDPDLGRRYVLRGQGPVPVTAVEQSSRAKSGGWSPTRTPNDLEEFSRLWDLLVSSGYSGHVATDRLEERVGQGKIIPNAESADEYKVREVKGIASSGNGEIHIAPRRDFVLAQPSIRGLSAIWAEMIVPVWGPSKSLRWNLDRDDVIAISPCRKEGSQGSVPLEVAFPVRLVNEEIDWTKEWIRRTIDTQTLSQQLRLRMEDKAGLPFADAFSDLRSEAEGFESLGLSALSRFLDERLDRNGPVFEFWGASIPSRLLQSAGLFLILIVQFYAMRHVSEAASRMAWSAHGDPGAFQPWIFLYDDPWSRYASLTIVVAPSMAALPIFLPLLPNSISTAEAAWIWLAFLASLGLAARAIDLPRRLRHAARRHRTSTAGCPS